MLNSTIQYDDIYSNLTFEDTGVVLAGGITFNEKDDTPINAAIYFDIITSHSIQLNSNITDNWLEDNTVVNDSIALPPLIVSLSGISSELVYVPSMNGRFLKQAYDEINTKLAGKFSNNYVVTDKLTVIPELYPPVDNITQTARNIVTAVEDNIDRYKKILNNFTSSTTRQTRLQFIYEKLSTIRNSRNPVVISTPYTTLENMYIQSLTLSQDNQNHITDISLTLKQANFSQVLTTQADKNVLAEINAASRAQVENHGKVQGREQSILYANAPEGFKNFLKGN